MTAREMLPGIFEVGAIDWDRRLFEEMIPLPGGTSYNSYLIRGSEKTLLIDTVDPSFAKTLFEHLTGWASGPSITWWRTMRSRTLGTLGELLAATHGPGGDERQMPGHAEGPPPDPEERFQVIQDRRSSPWGTGLSSS